MWNRKGVEKLSGTNGRSMRIRLRYFVVFHSKIPFELFVQEFLECCCKSTEGYFARDREYWDDVSCYKSRS